MPIEHRVAAAGLAFLIVGGLLLVRSVRRGSELCRRLAERLPEEYEELGSPRPGYFDSARRQAYFRFIMQRVYVSLSDPSLGAEFEELRRAEVRHLAFLVGGFVVFGIVFAWMYLWKGIPLWG